MKAAKYPVLSLSILACLALAYGSSYGQEEGEGESAIASVPSDSSTEPQPGETESVEIVALPTTTPALQSSDNICLKPLTNIPVQPEMLMNEVTSNDSLKGRYLVADLEIRDSDGRCLKKGVREELPPEELRDGVTMGEPMVISGTSNGCAGQSLSLCEVKGDRVELIARFALSAVGKKWLTNYAGYYAPINVIKTRHGDGRAVTSKGKRLDEMMGGGDERLLMYEGSDPMPNFMNFGPIAGLKGETQNGIHRYPSGQSGLLGTPASHGCMRVSSNGTRFTRNWTPIGAKFFIIHPTAKMVRK